MSTSATAPHPAPAQRPESSLPPGLRTDLGILRLQGSAVEDRGDHLLVRSPHNPQHHWGNALIVTTGDPDAAARWLGLYAAEFPDQDWVALGLPSAPGEAGLAVFEEAGVKVEELSSLESGRLPQIRSCPPGYEARPFASPEDWEQLLQADLAMNREKDEYDPVRHEEFVRSRSREKQRLAEQGCGRWFGAFAADGPESGKLCSSLGIVLLGEGEKREARYQSVLTGSAHRRRGLAGHLLGVAAQWSQGCRAERWTIVTEAENPAGRLYRSLGFDLAMPSFEAYRAPDR